MTEPGNWRGLLLRDALISLAVVGGTLAVGFDLDGVRSRWNEERRLAPARLRLEASLSPRERLRAAQALLALHPQDAGALAARREAEAALAAVTPARFAEAKAEPEPAAASAPAAEGSPEEPEPRPEPATQPTPAPQATSPWVGSSWRFSDGRRLFLFELRADGELRWGDPSQEAAPDRWELRRGTLRLVVDGGATTYEAAAVPAGPLEGVARGEASGGWSAERMR